VRGQIPEPANEKRNEEKVTQLHDLFLESLSMQIRPGRSTVPCLRAIAALRSILENRPRDLCCSLRQASPRGISPAREAIEYLLYFLKHNLRGLP